MTNILDRVEQHLFKESDLTVDAVQKAIGALGHYQQDYADIFLQEVVMEYWQLEDGLVKDASFNLNKGLGIRSIDGEKTGFAYANQFEQTALNNALAAATSISRAGQSKTISFNQMQRTTSLYEPESTLGNVEQAHKIALLRQLDAKARQLDEKVKQVIVSLSAADEHMMVAAIDGTLAADIRPMIRLNVTVVAEHDGRRERGSSGMGGRYSWHHLISLDLEQLAERAVSQALINLEAVEAPAGTMPVVLGNGWPGVLLHEAVGHGLEGDFNRKGSSAYANRMGQKVASELCTVVDDGTLQNQRGSLNVDDEGTLTQSNVLIEKGVLKGYMQDKHNARLMGQSPTGNGRRESYAHLPMPRMTNTLMLSGESEPEEIIRSVKKGVYAPNFAGGQVDITSGNFVFSASEAYLIEDGKLTAPIKGATLAGNGPEVLKYVSMVGNDSQLDPGIGICGKDGQSVPVCVGQPTLKVDQLTVGGTQSG
ncbi:metalloprotease TldD [Kangiella sediminilitoris]|uniref:Protease TldD n=1 Tax=Kangiella sediminilitoris TaxID=1144748 RepID=A0A1B3BCH1_9GAMM|nr:metalloprotease TldD [Kangiella sediminilitoris]AOE50511.1 protease TldD [Kangiella sediminilitoris]